MRFGLIGTGYWAREVHAAGIASHPEAELAGVWGRDPAKATALAAEFPGAVGYPDLGAMLDAVDAITCSVPPDVQADLAPLVAEAGRHLLLEKPIGLSVAMANRVVDAVERAGVASVVFFTERFIEEREDWLTGLRDAGGCLGAEAKWLASLQTPGNPFAHSPWRWAEGALWDVGPHSLAALLPVLGPVRAVAGSRGRGDLVHLVLTHDSDATSTVSLSLTMPPAAQRSSLEFYRDDGWQGRPSRDFDPVDAHRAAVGELISTVRAGQTAHRCDVRFGRDVVAVLERAQQVLGPPPAITRG
jgi:predicted dehydrogenase